MYFDLQANSSKAVKFLDQYYVAAKGIVSDVSTKYFLQIWSGAQAFMKLRPTLLRSPAAETVSPFRKSHHSTLAV